MSSNNAKITREQRDDILRTFVHHGAATAQAKADALHLDQKYVFKLARARGLVPRTAKRWGNLRESA